MFNSQDNNQITTGATVYDQSGEKLGTVAEFNTEQNYILVQKGWLFHKDFYVPSSAIERLDENGNVYLNLYKDDLNNGYDTPAFSNQGTDAGYATLTTDAAYANTAGRATMDTTQSGDIRVPVREEELVVGKRAEQQGAVHIHKDVIEEQQSIDVPVQRERVTVERVPMQGTMDAGTLDSDAFTERDFDVPVMGEEVTVGKRVHGVEEVLVHKDVVTENQQAQDTVRKERVVVDGADELTGNRIEETAPTRKY